MARGLGQKLETVGQKQDKIQQNTTRENQMKTIRISLIAALTDEGVIGKDNKLLWHLPADFAYFKKMTLGKPIIMGRKTFESIGKALPGRRNLVISQNPNFTALDCEVYSSLDAAVAAINDAEEIMIIGGSQIYQQALPIANKLYLTYVHHNFTGDTYFPEFNKNEWQLIEKLDFAADEKNEYAYSFATLIRRSVKL